jgi:short-subunit dehydrogenase
MGDVAVVMGAGPRLGRAVASALARRDAAVALLARSAARLSELAGEVGAAGPGRALPVAVDLADEESVRAAFAMVRQELGDPTVVVHNPSVTIEAAATETPYGALMEALRTSLGSLLVAAQEVAPAMRAAGRGTILATGSQAALAGSTWSAAVGIQKAAVRSLVLSLAEELGGAGVHVATVTVMGLLGRPGFEVDAIAEEYTRLVDETDGPPGAWRTEVAWHAGGPR